MAAPPITERHLPHFHRRAPMKQAVRVATTANITISTALNNGDTLDGVTLATDDRVLVKDQSTGSQNGIYTVGVTPVREYDESTDDPAFGYIVYVIAGTTNGGTLWRNTNTSSPTLGSTSLTFAQIGGGSGSSIYVNVKDYGAIGDDSHDDTSAIQDACDAITAGSGGIGGTLFFPRGTYKITAQIDVNAPMHVLGEGGPDQSFSKIHQVTTNTSAFVGVSPPYDMFFEDLWIQGPSVGTISTASSGDGIYSPRNPHLLNIRIDGFYNGVRIGNLSYYAKLINCLILWNANAGVDIHQDSNNTSFINVRSAYNKYGYLYHGTGGGLEAERIIGGAVENNTTAGIVADGDSGDQQGGFVIRDVYFESNVTDIKIGATTPLIGLVVEGCWFVNDNGGWHIDLLSGDRATIIGNTFQTSTADRDVRQNASFDNVALINNHPSSATSYSLQSDALNLDPGNTTAASAVGSAAAGTSPFLARIDHGHALGGTVAGDLSGTLPNPTVAKINGVAVTGTPAVGYVPTATSTSAATWQAQSGGTHYEPLTSGASSAPELVFTAGGRTIMVPVAD